MGKYPLKREMLDTKVGVAITTVGGVAITTVGGVAITTVGGVAITTVGGVALVIYDLVMTTSFFFRMHSSGCVVSCPDPTLSRGKGSGDH